MNVLSLSGASGVGENVVTLGLGPAAAPPQPPPNPLLALGGVEEGDEYDDPLGFFAERLDRRKAGVEWELDIDPYAPLKGEGKGVVTFDSFARSVRTRLAGDHDIEEFRAGAAAMYAEEKLRAKRVRVAVVVGGAVVLWKFVWLLFP
jgi:hypothetical protein